MGITLKRWFNHSWLRVTYARSVDQIFEHLIFSNSGWMWSNLTFSTGERLSDPIAPGFPAIYRSTSSDKAFKKFCWEECRNQGWGFGAVGLVSFHPRWVRLRLPWHSRRRHSHPTFLIEGLGQVSLTKPPLGSDRQASEELEHVTTSFWGLVLWTHGQSQAPTYEAVFKSLYASIYGKLSDNAKMPLQTW